jgi:hypothetical protein
MAARVIRRSSPARRRRPNNICPLFCRKSTTIHGA